MPNRPDSDRPARNARRLRLAYPLPAGDLFYPCSGRDLFAPLRLFETDGRTLHGADLDRFEFAELTRTAGIDAEPLESTPHSFALEGSFADPVSIHNLRNGEGWRPPSRGVRERFRVRMHGATSASWTVVRHRYDAVEAFGQLPTLALFYAVGDRCFSGEGSSGICWLGNTLFPRVLARMAPGSLLVTDGLGLERRLGGSVGGEMEDLDDESAAADQHPLWVRSPAGWPIADAFVAFGRTLRLVTGVDGFRAGRRLWVWRCE